MTDTSTPLPIVLNEANSLTSNAYGPTGLLNVFGDALWTMDYMLLCASMGFSRVHMQLGTDFRYSSWQPITTANTTKSTMPPYYGNIAVAAFLGNITANTPQIVNVRLPTVHEAAYAAYVDNTLARIAVINYFPYNTTVETTSSSGIYVENTVERPSKNYTFTLPVSAGFAEGDKVGVQRLLGGGSDVRTGISWDGWSYEYELDEGRPVRFTNVTLDEQVLVNNGTVTIAVLDSSAVILNF